MRTAIFGGTFDPIHAAHIAMAKAAADQFHLDRVLFVPAGNPPHKHAGTPYEHRFRMVELACAGDSRFVASRIEEGSAKSYSIHTIERVKRETDGDLFFMIGSDAFAELETWRRWEDVVRAIEFIVVARPGHAIEDIPGARVHRLDWTESPISSSEIRHALAVGQPVPAVPLDVRAYIREHGLYREG